MYDPKPSPYRPPANLEIGSNFCARPADIKWSDVLQRVRNSDMHQRLSVVAGLLTLNFMVCAPLQALDLFRWSAQKPTACEACRKSACCCKPDIFKCRPEPRYCKPDRVCCPDKYCVKPFYCKPDEVCVPCKHRVCPWYCKPEPVCGDPEPRCYSDCIPGKSYK